MYIDKLAGIVNKYNNTYYSTVKIKPIEVESSTYIDLNKKNNAEDLKFKVSDYVRISKYKDIFAKGYLPNSSEDVFLIKKAKNTLPWTYVIEDLNGEEMFGTFMKNNCKKQIKKSLELKQ